MDEYKKHKDFLNYSIAAPALTWRKIYIIQKDKIKNQMTESELELYAYMEISLLKAIVINDKLKNISMMDWIEQNKDVWNKFLEFQKTEK